MFKVKNIVLFSFVIIIIKADWVEIPALKPFSGPTKISGSTLLSESKTPMTVIFFPTQIENIESKNTTAINKTSTEDTTTIKYNNLKKIKPTTSSIMEVFSTTTFTPLMSSISIPVTEQTTTPAPIRRTTDSRVLRKKENKGKQVLSDRSDEIEIENAPNEDKKTENDKSQNEETPVKSVFSSYTGFMPFLKSIQSSLMQRVHKTVKSKIQVLKNLRDSLLYDIDQRIRRLWSRDESSARDYKGDSHIEFPSNEGALMTIGFLTLAVFLVKLVLHVIAAIKAKKMYYTTTTTTAATTGRKKRFVQNDVIDEELTYKILNLIDTYKFNYYDYN